MGRPKKMITLEEQLQKITDEIDQMEQHIKELKNTKKELENQIKQHQLEELDQLMVQKGLSVEDLRRILQEKISE